MQIFAKKKKRGFTLIEILVVVAIIGLLTAVLWNSMGGSRSKSRDTKREADMHQLVIAQEMYRNDNDAYVTAVAQNDTPVIGTRLNKLADPVNTGDYIYKWLDNTNCVPAGSNFCAYATLENKGTCANVAYFVASGNKAKVVCDTAPANGCTCQ